MNLPFLVEPEPEPEKIFRFREGAVARIFGKM